MKQQFAKIAISTTLSIGLAVSGVGPILHSGTVMAATNIDWIDIDNRTITMLPINEDDYSSQGQTVVDLLSGKVWNTVTTGIAIVGMENENGTWQYYDTRAGIWYNIPSTSEGAFLLSSENKIRFVPARDWNGTASISYKLWDQSKGNESSAFSTEEGSAQITVSPVNDMPYLTEVSGGQYYLGFDGNGDYVSFPDLAIYNNSFTVEGFLKVDGFNTWMRFFESSNGPSNNNIFVGFDRGRMNFSAYSGSIGPAPGSTNNITTVDSFPLSRWVHTSFVYDQSVKKGYIYWDGVLKAEGNVDLSVIGNVSHKFNWLGKSSWAQDGDFLGGMKDVRFWSKAKGQAEIVREMNSELSGSEPGLVANYKLNDLNGGNTAVSAPPEKNGQITGATWVQNEGFIGPTITNKNQSVTRSFKVNDPDNGDIHQVTASSSNQTLVSDNGLVVNANTLTITPNADVVGTALITVTVYDGELTSTYSFNLIVNNNLDIIVTGVTLDPHTMELTVGEEKTLIATVSPENATNKNLTWSSSDSAVATVDQDGKVTPVGPGNATITVTTIDGGSTDTAVVNVATKPEAPTNVTAIAGDGEATINFTAPSSNGGSPIINYTVTAQPGGMTVTGTESPIKMTGLDNGTEYTFTVTATNRAGNSESSVPSGAVRPVPPAPGAPVLLTPVAENGQVTLHWSPVDSATGYKVFKSENSELIDSEVVTVTGSVYSYTMTGLTNGATYYFVVKATNQGEDSAPSLPVSATPKTIPGVPTNVKAVAGNRQATITFTPPTEDGGSPITGYEVTASPGNLTVTGTASPITITGLNNGTGYTFTIKAINSVGNSESSVETSMAIPSSPSSGGEVSTPSQPTVPSPTPSPIPSKDTDILLNGRVEDIGKVTVNERNGQTVTTVSVDGKKLNDKLPTGNEQAVMSIAANAKSDVIIGELNGQVVKDLEDKHIVLEMRTGSATYTLPSEQINIDSIAKEIGKSVALQDIKVQIEIATSTADMVKIVESAATKGEFTLVSSPIDFSVKGIYGEHTMELTKFNEYVKRTIAIPEGIDPSKITTGVTVQEDGTVRHVPTKVTQIDGKYYATINSLTNGTYSIVWNPLEFRDVENHWSKDAVNNMGSRMVIEGVGGDFFNPDQNITRAEFSAIIVRGLGLESDNRATVFSDIEISDWYNNAIKTASEYQLIQGFGDGTFRPNDKITREQAMVIIAKVMELTELKDTLTLQSTDVSLRSYTDAAKASDWARRSIADSVQAGIISGRSSTMLAPKLYMTRAEVATIVERLLQKSDLI